MYRFRKNVGKSNLSEQFRKRIYRLELALAWIICGRLHAYLSNQSLLMAILHSLIARRWFGPQTQWRSLRKTLTSGFGLSICLWLGPPWFNYWFLFTLAYSRISHEYSPLFIIVINLNFMFSLWCIDWVGNLYANRSFMYFCIKSCIRTQSEVG